MGENIHEPGDKPDLNYGSGRKPAGPSDSHEKRDSKSSLGKAAFLIFCLAATAFVISLALK